MSDQHLADLIRRHSASETLGMTEFVSQRSRSQ